MVAKLSKSNEKGPGAVQFGNGIRRSTGARLYKNFNGTGEFLKAPKNPLTFDRPVEDLTQNYVPLTAEQNLLMAVLLSGLSDLESEGPQVYLPAVQWLLSDDDSYLFSFNVLCDAFNIDANDARRELIKRGGEWTRSIR